MMRHAQWWSPVGVAILVVIGCGGGTPRDASATTETREPDTPIQLAQAPAEAQAPAGGGTASVTGTARFEGTPPKPEPVQMAADPVCQQQHTAPIFTEAVAVTDGKLRNVFVYVKEGAQGPFPTPTTPVTLDQHGCWYMPHVFGIQVNQPLEIVNSDPTLHNVNAKPGQNRPFNLAQPVKGMKTSKTFAMPELGVKFKCNVHPWMSAYGHVVAHPYFSVSGQDGSFAITGLPAGTYVLEAWHETYGTETQTVSVVDGEAKSVEFTFKAP